MTQICIRVDEDVKAQAEAVCEELGMSMSTAINIYLKKIGRERRIPFDLTVEDGRARRRSRDEDPEDAYHIVR